jgi:hypothetical protein
MTSREQQSRRVFISSAALGTIGTLGATGLCSASPGPNANTGEVAKGKGLGWGVSLRPHQLLCAICSIGEGGAAEEDGRIKAIRENPDIPVTLVCNAGDIFAFQDPGPADDMPGGPGFNRKLDLEILQRLDLNPGATLTARIIQHRIWDRIESLSGICDLGEETSHAWKSCPKSGAGFYEKGREISLKYAVPSCGSQVNFSETDLPNAKASRVLIIPRTREERMEEKRKALEAMNRAEAIPMRPHLLLCAVCQYGGGARPPYDTDNLPEMIQFILKNHDAKIKMADGADWMMCAPCPSRNKANGCVHVKGYDGLPNQLIDIRTLQKLGMTHGDVMNARELYQRIFEKIPDSNLVCGTVAKGAGKGSVWDEGCGHHSEKGEPYQPYIKGRELLIKEFGFAG